MSRLQWVNVALCWRKYKITHATIQGRNIRDCVTAVGVGGRRAVSDNTEAKRANVNKTKRRRRKGRLSVLFVLYKPNQSSVKW